MNKLWITLAATTVLAGCATHPAPAPVAVAEAAPPVIAPPAAPAPKPQIGDYGFDTTGMDTASCPGDNFYQYANGTWAKNTPIPADKSNYGMFTMLDDLSRDRTATLIEDAAKDPNSRIGAVYASFMDEAGDRGEGPGAAQAVARPDPRALKIKAGLPQIYAAAGRLGVGTPFGGFVGQDDKAPDQYILSSFQAGLGMPDRDYYLSKDPKLVETKAKYLAHLTNMLTLAGEKNAAARAKAIVDFETRIAEVKLDPRRKPRRHQDLQQDDAGRARQARAGLRLRRLIQESGAPTSNADRRPAERDHRRSPGWSTKAPLGVLKDQLLVRSLDSYAAYLPTAFDKENFSFYGTTLSGTPRAGGALEAGGQLHHRRAQDDVSKLYVAQIFPARNQGGGRRTGQERHRRDGPPHRQARLDGAGDQGQGARQARRLHAQDRLPEPVARHVGPGRSIAATRSAMRCAPTQFDYAYNIGKLGKPIYRWEWGMTPMTINAYANFGMVEIVFPAAILQPPFFDPNADPAINYGGIGAVIGHELSHHFDDQGAKYDKSGRLSRLVDAGRRRGVQRAGSTRSASNMTPMSRCPACTSRAS